MPVFSLPSPYGIGTFGKAAYDFIDFLEQSGQSFWQMLPLGPTGYGDSPYQSFSTYAGNPYYIDLDMLRDDGLLTQEEISSACPHADNAYVDYGTIYSNRFRLLAAAAKRGLKRDEADLEPFIEENSFWLHDYALYMAVKKHFGMKPWTEWPDDAIRLRDAAAMDRYRDMLGADIAVNIYTQYLFFRQWNALRSYARSRGIGIIGDLPIYVSMDSADVWAAPELFQLDSHGYPIEVSGVPPDYFSEDGQLWGNPLYAWDIMKQDDYDWWMHRIYGASKLYDTIRIDHFRGLESYWAVPYGQPTARCGRWVTGPGIDFVRRILSHFPGIQFIAEDLGLQTDEVRKLLADSGLPGMKVLEFAFDSNESNNCLPHLYSPNCICYTGTHDNAPLLDWEETISPNDRACAEKYLKLKAGEKLNRAIIRSGINSVAELFIAPIQDYLELGRSSRINTPGQSDGNWRWRLVPGQLTQQLAAELADMAHQSGR